MLIWNFVDSQTFNYTRKKRDNFFFFFCRLAIQTWDFFESDTTNKPAKTEIRLKS